MTPEEIAKQAHDSYFDGVHCDGNCQFVQSFATALRDYGAACAAEMCEKAAQIADQKRLGSYDAREIAAAIRALPLAL